MASKVKQPHQKSNLKRTLDMKVKRFLDPQNDAAFKKVFASPENKDLLISFLNGLLRRQDEELIKNVEHLNIEMIPHTDGTKRSALDIRCTDQRNFQYIVEIQKKSQTSFLQRAQHYVAGIYGRQAIEGQDYLILRPVILLSILNHKIFPNNIPYLSYHNTRELTSGECFLKDMAYVFVELPKFEKSESDLKTLEDYWIDFLKTAPEHDEVPEDVPEVIQKAYHVLERFHWTNLEIEAYEQAVRAELDERDAFATAIDKGRKEGEEKGRKEEKYEIARNLLGKSVPPDLIQEVTGLTPEEIRNLT